MNVCWGDGVKVINIWIVIDIFFHSTPSTKIYWNFRFRNSLGYIKHQHDFSTWDQLEYTKRHPVRTVSKVILYCKFREITCNVAESVILHDIFPVREISRFIFMLYFGILDYPWDRTDRCVEHHKRIRQWYVDQSSATVQSTYMYTV